jgi:hypothetical protein
LKIDLLAGTLEVEGAEDFILKVYEDAKKADLFKRVPVHAPPLISAEEIDEPKTKIRKAPSKRGGPSCAERIAELLSNSFFDTPKSANEIKLGLEQNGHAYASNQVGAALTNLYQRGILRRLKPGKEWVYQKP